MPPDIHGEPADRREWRFEIIATLVLAVAAEKNDEAYALRLADLSVLEEANGYSDTYTLSTVLFASALFFAAISDRFAVSGARASLLGLAGVIVVVGMVVAFSQPLTTG